MARSSEAGQQKPVDQEYKNLSLTGGLDLSDNTRTSVTATTTLTTGDAMVQNLKPTTTKPVKLPAATAANIPFWIGNRTNGTNSITVQNNGGTALTTLAPGDTAFVVSDGTGWIATSSSGTVE